VLPTLESLGLGHVATVPGVNASTNPDGCFGRIAAGSGPDALAGLWELIGLAVPSTWRSYEGAVPDDVLRRVTDAAGRPVIGNRRAIGAAAFRDVEDERVRSGALILSSTGESVLQLAAHQDAVPVAELQRVSRAAWKALAATGLVARLVAQPFAGSAGAFVAVEGRRDYALEPPQPMLLDEVKRAGQPVVGIGALDDLLVGRGFTRPVRAESQSAVLDHLQRTLATAPRGLVAALVTDACGCRAADRDARTVARTLQEFDRRLPDLLGALRPGDALFVIGNHGADPTMPELAHTAEYVPLLAYGPKLGRGVGLGTRRTAADLGQTIADAMGAKMLSRGESFLDALQPG
jgi:phosphopentomutase